MFDETFRHPHFARLFALWTTKFSQDWSCDIISYTTATILITQEAHFMPMDDATGVVRIIDTDSNPIGGFYVTNPNSKLVINSHASSTGPLLLKPSSQTYMPTAYSEYKIIKLSTVKGWQTAPRTVWNMSITMGYATARSAGARFQGLTSADVQCYEASIDNAFLDC